MVGVPLDHDGAALAGANPDPAAAPALAARRRIPGRNPRRNLFRGRYIRDQPLDPVGAATGDRRPCAARPNDLEEVASPDAVAAHQ